MQDGAPYHRVSVQGWEKKRWLNYRLRGLGGSDIPAVLGVPGSFKSRLQLHLEKLEEYPSDFPETEETYAGRLAEPVIARMYQHWDGSMETVWENDEAEVVCNRWVDPVAFFVSNEHPFLFCSPDREILSHREYEGPGILECKNSRSFVQKKYEAGISYSYVCQVAQNLLVSGYSYGEIAVKIDGGGIRVFPVLRDDPEIQELFEVILQECKTMWDKISQARVIKKELGLDKYFGLHPELQSDSKLKAGLKELHSLEPSLEPFHPKTKELLNKIFVPEKAEMPGDMELYELAIQFEEARKQESEFKRKKDQFGNLIKATMKGVERISFADGEAVSWPFYSDGKRRFSVKIGSV